MRAAARSTAHTAPPLWEPSGPAHPTHPESPLPPVPCSGLTTAPEPLGFLGPRRRTALAPAGRPASLDVSQDGKEPSQGHSGLHHGQVSSVCVEGGAGSSA